MVCSLVNHWLGFKRCLQVVLISSFQCRPLLNLPLVFSLITMELTQSSILCSSLLTTWFNLVLFKCDFVLLGTVCIFHAVPFCCTVHSPRTTGIVLCIGACLKRCSSRKMELSERQDLSRCSNCCSVRTKCPEIVYMVTSL